MNKPSIDEMLINVDGGKYALAVAAAKRARMITEERGNKIGQTQAVSEALQEIARGNLKYTSSRQSEK